MSIVFGAITPHPPIIIPGIGKENLEQLEKTILSLNELNEDLKNNKVETLLIISPHGMVAEEFFSINSCEEFNIQFEEFGDLATRFKLSGDSETIKKIKDDLKDKLIKFNNAENLDHGCGVPLFYLAKNLPKLQIIPLYFSGLNLEEHFSFGKKLGNILKQSKKKIGVLASGDLSHRLNKHAPAGYSPKGKKFDNKLIEFLKNKKLQDILDFNENLIEDAGECGLRSIVILLGIMDGLNYETEILSYEYPFGVGYLTAKLNLKI